MAGVPLARMTQNEAEEQILAEYEHLQKQLKKEQKRSRKGASDDGSKHTGGPQSVMDVANNSQLTTTAPHSSSNNNNSHSNMPGIVYTPEDKEMEDRILREVEENCMNYCNTEKFAGKQKKEITKMASSKAAVVRNEAKVMYDDSEQALLDSIEHEFTGT